MATLIPSATFISRKADGTPNALGKVYTYAAGTLTPQTTYTTQAAGTPNTNPVILDADGTAQIWGTSTLTYRIIEKTAADATIRDTDNYSLSDLADLASIASATKGAGLVGFSYTPNYAVATLGWSVKHMGIDITQAPFLADKTGATDASAAINAAIAAFPGMPLYAPAGTYRLDSEVAYVTSAVSVFTPGFQINGAGSNKTIFDTRVANGFAFRCATTTLGTFQHTVKFTNLRITTNGAPAVAGGISIRSCYVTTIEDVWIEGLSGDGIRVIMTDGDQDGSNLMTLRNVRLESCLGWGFNVEVTGAYNEFSFLRFDQVFIQTCGTASATVPPPSGGMRWKGQIFNATNAAFVVCQNVGLYIQGGAGLSNTAVFDSCTWENNIKKSFYCDGIDSLALRRCQFYNNDGNVAQNGVQLVGTTYSVRNVEIDGTIIRATSGNNPYTAFSITGPDAALDTCRVRGTVWQNHDYTGQTRFTGWRFDPVPMECPLVVLSTTSVAIRPEQTATSAGNKMPIRLRGSNAGSTTGEWSTTMIASGGLAISNSGLANSTRYYCYLYDNAGVPTLELSTTAYATDTASGYSVKSGDATRLYVGSVVTDGAAAFRTTNTGYLNPTKIAGQQAGVYAYMWYSGTSGFLRYTSNGALPTSDTDGVAV